jgi:hypothetical protein
MRKLLAVAMLSGLAMLFAGTVSAQEKMKAAPALDPSLLESAPVRQDECYRWGWRGWGRYKNCSCVKCSWKLAPAPQRFCWRVC